MKELKMADLKQFTDYINTKTKFKKSKQVALSDLKGIKANLCKEFNFSETAVDQYVSEVLSNKNPLKNIEEFFSYLVRG